MPDLVFSTGQLLVNGGGQQITDFFICRKLTIVIFFDFSIHLLCFPYKYINKFYPFHAASTFKGEGHEADDYIIGDAVQHQPIKGTGGIQWHLQNGGGTSFHGEA